MMSEYSLIITSEVYGSQAGFHFAAVEYFILQGINWFESSTNFDQVGLL